MTVFANTLAVLLIIPLATTSALLFAAAPGAAPVVPTALLAARLPPHYSTSPNGVLYDERNPSPIQLTPKSLDAVFDGQYRTAVRAPPIPTKRDERRKDYFTSRSGASSVRERGAAPAYRISRVEGVQTSPVIPAGPRESVREAAPQDARDARDADAQDEVWETLRAEAHVEAANEPLLVSYLHSTILNHASLESSLAFHMASRLSSPSMIATQLQSLFVEAFEQCPELNAAVRADLMAVYSRDPACTCLPDAFLYFKGFHALVAHRVAKYLWGGGRELLASYLQSQTSQNFQIDIHPNATLGSGIMLDHGTGTVIGSTAVVGDNCSILHHVTLGGSGRKDVDRHPKVGEGCLIGAGSSILGNVRIGNRVQIGAGSLVLEDVDDNAVVVGVPARVVGKVGVEAPAEAMDEVSVLVEGSEFSV
ncbi:hypothetical protein TeGR_g3057 [Tetraparma gracilis]|uniref:serine O-acetyltransferase n=1 Tax=Tetraparma gracilis TaxID=2962635 RepID=A0ABQ6N3G0_9STRA|nr:hypothetical protein TeGR_g3057 [Tetraparma gracilis]